MKHNLTVDQVSSASFEAGPVQVANSAAKKGKKPSWLHTILWMLSMVLLVNVVMGVLFYLLYHYKIIN